MPNAHAEITWEQVMAVRMRRHMLEERGGPADLIPLARMLCGFHAQVLSSAELTAAVRLDGLRPGDITRRLWEERTLYKTWAMRGTLHLLPSDQFGVWVGALSHLPRADDSAAWRRYFGIDSATVDAMIAATDQALREGMQTRQSLAEAVARISRQPDLKEKLASSWGAYLKPSARLGHVCFAPGEGSKVRFTHPLAWLPGVEDVDPDEAMRIALRQFLHTYGPASREDFMRWFGIRLASLGTRLLGALEDETVEVRIVGEPKPYIVLAADLAELEAAAPSATIRMLGPFDQYVVNAPRRIEAILPNAQAGAVYRPQGWISAVIVRGGAIIGTWTYELGTKSLDIAISLFAPAGKREIRAIEEEAERLAGFYDRPLTLQWTP